MYKEGRGHKAKQTRDGRRIHHEEAVDDLIYLRPPTSASARTDRVGSAGGAFFVEKGGRPTYAPAEHR
jgi:hypothetical protein